MNKHRRTLEEIEAKAKALGLIHVSDKDIDDYCCFLNDMGDGCYWRSEVDNRVYYATDFDDDAVALNARDVTDSIISDIKDLKKYM